MDKTMKNASAHERGFTLVELVVAMAVMALMAALLTPNFMEEINQRRANLTAQDTQSILDAVRSYRSNTGSWPGGAGCTTAISVLTTANYLRGVTATNRYNQAVTTTCTANTFSVVQRALPNWDGYLVNSLPGTTITNAGSNQITSSVGVPGSEPALSAKLSRVATGNVEDNRMRTTLYMGNQQITEAGNLTFSTANPVIRANSGNLNLSAASGNVVIPAGQVLHVDDIVVRSRGSRRLSASLPNFVHVGTYIVRHGWYVLKPTCAAGGVAKAAMRPGAMRGGFSGSYDPAYVGRYGFNYRLDSSGSYWVVTAIAEGYAVDFANLDSLVDVFCYYST
jgi:prepilin-type N-terminal cleavage/methylation domain-containing protein